jgi:hypothetical protein
MATALVGACSKPPAETGLDDNLGANLELALQAAAAEPVVAVASELEAPRPQARVQRPPPQQAPEPEGDDADVATNEKANEAAVKPDTDTATEPTFTVSPLPTTWADPVPVSGPVARTSPEETGTATGGGNVADDDMDGRSRGRGRGPVIIIRGGIGERDPCAIHMPGGGVARNPGDAVGVLINERIPRAIPGMGNPTLPRGGNGGFGRGGIRF